MIGRVIASNIMKLRTLPKLFGVLLGVSVSTALLSGCIVASRPAYGYATYQQPGTAYYNGGYYQGRYYRQGYYRNAPFVQYAPATTTVYTAQPRPAYGYGGQGGVYVGGTGVSGAVRVGSPVY